MVMNADQFEQFLKALLAGKETGERLASIETLVKAGNESAERFRIDVASKVKTAEDCAKSAHKRIDTLPIYGALCVLLSLAALTIKVMAGQ